MEENISEYFAHYDTKIKEKKHKFKAHHIVICLIIVAISIFFIYKYYLDNSQSHV